MRSYRVGARLSACTILCLVASNAAAQTLGPGVFNTPPTDVPTRTTLVSNTTLNVLPGSDINQLTLGDRFAPSTNIVVNLRGGDLDLNDVYEGSTVNVESGSLGTIRLELAQGTTLNVSGGVVQPQLMLTNGARLALSGGAISGATFDDPGTTAEISGGSTGRIAVGLGAELTMSAGEIEEISAFTSKITITGGSVPQGIFSPFNGDIDISGGFVGGLSIADGSLTVSGGDFGGIFVQENTPATITGGTINGLGVGPNSPTRLFGTEFLLDGQPIPGLVPGVPYSLTERNQTLTGFFADGRPFDFDLEPDPSGNPDDFFSVDANVTLHIVPEPASAMLLFSLAAIAATRRSMRSMRQRRPLAGIAALAASALIASPALAQTLGPGVFDSPPTVVPRGTTLVSETTLNVLPGADISFLSLGDHSTPNTNIVVNVLGGELDLSRVNQGSTINVESGNITDIILELPSATSLNVSGGRVAAQTRLTGNAEVSVLGGAIAGITLDSSEAQATVAGGVVEGNLSVEFGAKLSVTGGEIQRLRAIRGDINITDGIVHEVDANFFPVDLDISGGQIGPVFLGGSASLKTSGGSFDRIFVSDSGEAIVRGGIIDELQAGFDGALSLFGTEFLLDGQPIPGLTPGVPYQLTERNQTLTGFFADGSPFSFDLDLDPSGNSGDFFSVDANVTLHLVPEPASATLLFSLAAIAATRRSMRSMRQRRPLAGIAALAASALIASPTPNSRRARAAGERNPEENRTLESCSGDPRHS